MAAEINKCSWCGEPITNRVECRTVRKNGKIEHFHYGPWKDCLHRKILAIAEARRLLQNEDR